MSKLLYIAVGLLSVIWATIFLSINAAGLVHVMLMMVILVLLVKYYSKKGLSNK